MKGVIFFLCIFLIIGIVGKVECGASEWHLLWAIPCFAVLAVVGIMGEIENERELRRYDAWKERKARNGRRY